MSEEVKKDNETIEPVDKPNEQEKTKKQMDIERSLQEIDAERKEKDEQQRFGYFSIPYPSTVGDQAYSQNAEYHHRVEDRKVIIENRGIYVQGPKSGKGPDVYFPDPEIPEKWIERNENDKKIREERNNQ